VNTGALGAPTMEEKVHGSGWSGMSLMGIIDMEQYGIPKNGKKTNGCSIFL
jgi:hypothetical protein